MIERNKHIAGRLHNMLFGVACIADGLVRILSLGFLHSRFPIEVSKAQVRRIAALQIAKRQQDASAKLVDEIVSDIEKMIAKQSDKQGLKK